MAKARWDSTLALLGAAAEILRAEHPMTIRQLFYRLVSVRRIENTKAHYRRVSAVLTEARERGEVDWDFIVDRSRPSYRSASWTSLEAYGEVVAASYRKDYWQDQPAHVVILVEKDAIVGSVEPVATKYGVEIRTLRGFSSATVAHEMAIQFSELERTGKRVHILFLGDHDPSGRAIERDVSARIEQFMAANYGKGRGLDARQVRRAHVMSRVPNNIWQEIVRRATTGRLDLGGFNLGAANYRDAVHNIEFCLACRYLGLDPKSACLPFLLRRLAVHPEDIAKFNLPPLRVKDTDPRASGFHREHGDRAVELDALPPSELRRRLSRAILAVIDKSAWERAMVVERAERNTTRKVAAVLRELPAVSADAERMENNERLRVPSGF